MELEPAKAILSDSNSALINSYQKLKSDPSKVLSFVLRWPRTKDFYYTLRATIPSESKDDVFGAARFLYLNRLCFNGVYRENKSGYFNVPYAESRSGQFPTEKEFLEFSKELQKAEIVCSDFGESLDRSEKDDFVYLDPPYSYSEQRHRGEYGYNVFTCDDEERLIKKVSEASERGVKILISYNKAQRLRKKLVKWHLSYAPVRRSVAGFSKHRKVVREFQLRNYV